jgi:hypothetical protein
MEKSKRILPALMIVLAILGLLTTPVLAKDDKKTGSKKPKNHASAIAASAASEAHASHLDQGQKIGHPALKTGPAWKTLGGTLKNVHGDVYMVEDYEGNQVQLHVGQGTQHIHKKKVGDTVRVEITQGGFANSVQ